MSEKMREEEPGWKVDYEAKKEVRERVRGLLFEGEKIAAIKAVREGTGLGLKEAKDVVEGLERELREKEPGRFKYQKGKGGCAGVVLVMIGVAATVVWVAM